MVSVRVTQEGIQGFHGSIQFWFCYLENTVGDACEGDSDGDSVADTEDHCPHNPAITDTSFKSYTIVYPDPSIVDTDALIPEFRVNHDGKEILMTQPTNISFMLLGMVTLETKTTGMFHST